MGGDWARNQKRANFLVQRFQKDAKSSVGTTKDFVDMGSLLTGPLSRAGASMEDIADVTKGAVIASRAFGIEADVAARDIEQALAGTLGQKDRFARALLEPMGITTKEWNKMVRESPGKAAAALKGAFEQPAIQKMADEQKNSWAGVTSTLEDNLQRAFAKVGLPLMKRMTAEIQKITQWFEENPEKVNAIAEKLAKGLVSAFEMAKSVFGFIARHKDLLLTIAKAALIFKAAGAITRGLAGFGGLFSLNNAAAEATKGMTGFSKGLMGTVAKFGRVAGILGTVAVGAQAVADFVLKKQEERIKRTTDDPMLKEQARLLGGAAAGSGTGIMSMQVRGAQTNARQLGFTDDLGAIAASMEGNRTGLMQQVHRRMSLQQGKATAGDKLMAQQVAKSAKDAGFLGKEGKLTAKGLNKAFGAFGVSDIGGAGGMLANAAKNRAVKTLRGGGSMAEVLAHLEEVNDQFATKELSNMIQFLRGLERANLINNAQNKMTWEEAAKKMRDSVVKGFMPLMSVFSLGDAAKKEDIAKDKKKGAVIGSRNTNVRISKIEVVSDDPDRFAHNLVGAFNDQTVSPSQARRAIQER